LARHHGSGNRTNEIPLLTRTHVQSPPAAASDAANLHGTGWKTPTAASLIFGGLIADWRRGPAREDDPALFASGLIAGDALLGIAFAGVVVAGWDGVFALRTPGTSWLDALLTIIPFALLAAVLFRYVKSARA
jgi:hypothetical protein